MIKRTYPQSRLRRTRAKSFLRDLVAENHLSTNDLIQPIFISDQSEKTVEIPSMPGIYRHNLDSLYSETEALIKVGIKSVAIFPAIDADKKDQKGSHAFDDDNIVCLALKGLVERFPEVIKIADVALDPFTDHGHDGVLLDGKVDNDQTLELLQNQALILAQSGADVLAPSDMMDGRVLDEIFTDDSKFSMRSAGKKITNQNLDAYSFDKEEKSLIEERLRKLGYIS